MKSAYKRVYRAAHEYAMAHIEEAFGTNLVYELPVWSSITADIANVLYPIIQLIREDCKR